MTEDGPSGIRAGSAKDWPAIRKLLSGAGLPVEDLGADLMPHFLVACGDSASGHEVVGAVALQTYAKVGLLRSLVVADKGRSSGCGTRLLREMESKAKNLGLEELWLLTIDADRFFSARGFCVASRDRAPKSIRETPEFSSLCPDSAALMFKSLR